MKLATILPRPEAVPLAAAATPDGAWIPLAALAKHLGWPAPASGAAARLEEFLPALLPRLAEGTAWLRDWARQRDGFLAAGGEVCATAAALLPPVVRPPSFRDFYAFEQHVKTCRAKRGLAVPPVWYEVPVFYFSNPHALAGPEAAVFAPADSQELDYELELGVVIGRGGRDIPAERAWAHVAGFTVLNDFSARDLQRREVAAGLGPAKGKDFATALGPVLVTRDEFADRIDGERLALEMTARVNGRELSRGNTAALHHPIPRLVAQAARDAELFPGDLLGSGTVGTGCILELGPENTGGWLKPGDTVELEIERLGVLRTHIVARP